MGEETERLDPVATLAALPLRPFGNGAAFECQATQVA